MIIDSGLVTGSLQVIGNTTMTGSLSVTGDINGNLKGNAQSATSASFAVTASFAHFAATPTVQGIQGIQGIQGVQGAAGYVGSDGAQGTQGVQGRQGTIGAQGTTGTQGIQGLDGGMLTAGSYVARGVKNGTDQTVTGGADAVVTFVDDFDPNGWITSNQFKPTIAGYYSITTAVWWNAGSVTNNQTNIQFRKNGNTQIAIQQKQIVTGSGYGQDLATVVYLNGTTDYIEVTAYSGNPTSQNINGAAGGTYIAAALYAYGAQGIQGRQGTTGTQGATGTQGTVGNQGVTGASIQGTTGSTGSQGTTGSTGAQGTSGTNGSQGTTGTQGSTGSTGAQGIAGTGIQGTTGVTGSQGTTGAQGATGTGTQGATGASGGIASYTNASDNRVLTSVSSTTINAEANLTFDGTTLNVASNLRAGNGNSGPAGTAFSHTLAGVSTNRVVNFDGNGTTPSVWWTNGSRAYGAIDAQDPGMTFWANNGSGWQQQMAVNYGNVTINTDIRTPILYDSNNTGYYVDPASSTYINVLTNANIHYSNYNTATGIGNNSFNTAKTVLGNIHMNNGGGTSGNNYQAAITFQGSNANESQAGIYVSNNGSTGTAMGFATTDSYATGPQVFMTATNAGTVSVPRSYLQSDSSLRAPLFYDSNDTSYYADFNSTADNAVRQRGGTLHGPNPSWGAYLMVGGDGRNNYINNTGVASVAATNGNLHLDSASGYSTHINYYDGNDIIIGGGANNEIGRVYNAGYLVMNGSVRTPIFYSSDNTAKYLTNNTSTYGAWYLGGSNGGYSGFRFDGDMQLMMHTNGAAGPCGFWLGNWSILTYVNSAQYLYHNGSEKFRTDGGGIYVTGTVYATGDVIAYYSDIRLKKDVTLIDNALDKIKRLRGVTYIWNDEEVNTLKDRAGTKDIGLIAQEVEAVEPLLITEYQTQLNTPSNDPDEANDFVPRMSPTYKTIKYEKLVALLVEGMKEQQTQIEELKQLVQQLTQK